MPQVAATTKLVPEEARNSDVFRPRVTLPLSLSTRYKRSSGNAAPMGFWVPNGSCQLCCVFGSSFGEAQTNLMPDYTSRMLWVTGRLQIALFIQSFLGSGLRRTI